MTDDAHDPDEDLVAYLDGELDAVDAEGVETRLSGDAATRSRAETYRKTFDLLDYLPKPEPSPTFASRTLTKLDAVKPPVAVKTTKPFPWLRLMAWSIAALLAIVIGYASHLVAKPHLEKRAAPTLQQVRVLERLPLTLGIDDLDFLRKLQDSDLFNDDEPEPAKPAPAEVVTSAELSTLEGIYRKLPLARQQQLIKFDDDFTALDASSQAKLTVVMERYAVWLQHLPEKYRQEVLGAPAAAERLDAVRRVRLRQWRENLPVSVRTKLDETTDIDEAEKIKADYRKRDAERRNEWMLARQEWETFKGSGKPLPFDSPEVAKQVDEFVANILKSRLTAAELARLEEYRREAANNFGAKYLYGNYLQFLAETHPSLPEPKSGKPPQRMDDFPADLLRRLRQAGKPVAIKKDWKDLPQHGKWPEFAEFVAKEMADRNIPQVPPFGPCRPGEFKPEVEETLTVLLPKLTPKETSELENLQGKWPQYPKLMLEYAKKYDLSVPGVTLPGNPSSWAKAYPLRKK